MWISDNDLHHLQSHEWLAGWTAKPAILGSILGPVAAEIATSNSALGNYLIEHCYQKCSPLGSRRWTRLEISCSIQNRWGFHRIST